MNCSNPFYLDKEGIWVPCGRCILCRIQRAKEWSTRLCHEIGYWDKTAFVTLTYAPEHLPASGSVSKRELQLFFKRLRKNLATFDRKIAYYASGEYGDENGRPHYHVILFGMDNSKADKLLLEKAWGLGIVYPGTATYDSCRYVADYVQKKLYGLRAKEYEEAGIEQPFSLMSQKIGKRWAEDNYSQLIANHGFTLHGAKQSIPRYYVKILNIPTEWIKENSNVQNEVKRAKFKKTHKDTLWMEQQAKRAKRLTSEAENKQSMFKKGVL